MRFHCPPSPLWTLGPPGITSVPPTALCSSFSASLASSRPQRCSAVPSWSAPRKLQVEAGTPAGWAHSLLGPCPEPGRPTRPHIRAPREAQLAQAAGRTLGSEPLLSWVDSVPGWVDAGKQSPEPPGPGPDSGSDLLARPLAAVWPQASGFCSLGPRFPIYKMGG